MGIIDSINSAMSTGVSWISAGRNILINIVGASTVTLVFLILSLILGYMLAKKWNSQPLSGSFIGWYLLISLMIFLILNYV